MKSRELLPEEQSLEPILLDHSQDFVRLVCEQSQAEYDRLMGSRHIQQILGQENNFNFGKVFVFAEFVVFRREFKCRFLELSGVACINAFSRLFLKNDISISNLVRFMEGSDDLEQLKLNKPDTR